jgi:hypothetical protein
MQSTFRSHFKEFDQLREMIAHDSAVQAVFLDYTVPSINEACRRGFSRPRWQVYRQYLQRTHVRGIFRSDNAIIFEASVFGLGLHGSYKGYMYTSSQPKRLESNLDDASGGDCGYILRSLPRAAWYLYLRDCTSDSKEILHGSPK